MTGSFHIMLRKSAGVGKSRPREPAGHGSSRELGSGNCACLPRLVGLDFGHLADTARDGIHVAESQRCRTSNVRQDR